ncbi:gamma-polyglutamate biosynthesis protein CapA [Enterococcus sp. DIV2402]|uniref:Gamma-polyglutamate biosynthesis protein CapA n=1 Tax=Candidatus Enterococcus lowellii TaxID=2230877 RepID=A0ABZ2SP91_9ENTE|nr:CapA family protein [Enterococcus sp. DIV2402]MBO0464338.1 CapA family protein [Enterococcus sp. DIV2402]
MNKLSRRKLKINIVVGLLVALVISCLVTTIMIIRHTKQVEAENVAQKAEAAKKKKAEMKPLTEPLLGLQEKEKTNAKPDKEGEFVLRSVGDLLIHETVSYMADISNPLYQSAMEILSADGVDVAALADGNETTASTTEQVDYDFSPMFAQIAPFTQYADATIANLEVITAYPELPISGYPQFNSPSSLLNNVKNIGVDIVSNGTNHTLDWFSEGALTSIEHIREAGLMYVGSYRSEKDQQTPRIIDENGIKLGFLTYSYGTNGIPVDPGKEYTISLVDVEKMVDDVTKLKDQVDAVVVTLQLGQEYETLPDDNQRYVFEMLSEAGVKLILGGHPHVLQPMDWYNGKETFAIYSQASFLTGQVNIDNKQGGITEVTFKRQDDGEVVVTNPKFMPIFILGTENEKMYEVVPYADYAKYEIPQGQEWWGTIEERMKTYTDEFDYVTHLETARTKEAQDKHR